MNTENILTMPFRFDYGFNYEFNKTVDAICSNPDINTIILDCEQMEYIDSVGIGLLVMAYKKSQTVKKTIEMININQGVREVLLLTNIQKIIHLT